jgi:hypothetical protein
MTDPITPERRVEILAHAERYRWRPYLGLEAMARHITELFDEVDRLNGEVARLEAARERAARIAGRLEYQRDEVRRQLAEARAELAEREDDAPSRIAAELDRDEAREIARLAYRLWLSPQMQQIVGKDGALACSTAEALGVDALPDWLTADHSEAVR